MILYYSGTGNSLSIAEQIAEGLQDTTLHINEAPKVQVIEDKTIGLVLPVHNYDAPRLVIDALQKLEFPNLAYAFCVITHGGDKGNTVYSIKELLKSKGKDLMYHNDIIMPVNSRIMYGMVTDKIDERIGLAQEKVTAIIRDIINLEVNTDSISQKRLYKWGTSLVEKKRIRRYFTPVIDAEACTNCGICQKVCPVDNISVRDGKSFIGDNCEQCMACMHWCPQVAIHFSSRSIKKEQQYHHPNKKVKDIAVR